MIQLGRSQHLRLIAGLVQVNVTVHPFPAPLGHAEEDEEHSPPGRWSVLRFAGSGPDSLQSVARNTAVHVHGTQVWAMQPDCLAFEYTKTIASIGAVRLLVGKRRQGAAFYVQYVHVVHVHVACAGLVQMLSQQIPSVVILS